MLATELMEIGVTLGGVKEAKDGDRIRRGCSSGDTAAERKTEDLECRRRPELAPGAKLRVPPERWKDPCPC